MSRQALVLDANILIRAVLGQKVFKLLNEYHGTTAFFAPDDAFADAEKYLPQIFEKRGLDWDVGATVLRRLPTLVQCVDHDIYSEFETKARQRIRDTRDWPVLATALALDSPVWTEDQDFFGSGVATWNTGTVLMYLIGVDR
ncbi:MAG TPA: PIN domain-containing protein [Burkholderiaceae bacterium]|jgi:predicted nucleic acid-binding protein|nr:PIN domain-containing protein [Burkholderiaceae bacterium]